jgi:hypothetical protein
VFYLNEIDTLIDNDKTVKTIDCGKLGNQVAEFSFGVSCTSSISSVKYQIHYTIEEFEAPMVQLKYLYNINAPSEWTSDIALTSYFSGDELNLIASFDGIHG